MAAVATSLGFSSVSKTSSAAVLSKAEIPAAAPEDAGVRSYNVRNYGAKGDGKTLDTEAFQAAIDACTNDKGGTVLVPAGEFLIGSIELKSDVTFHLAAAARLLGSTNIGHYRKGVEDVPFCDYALVYAIDAANLSIEGKGTIDGQGAKFLPGAKDGGETTPGRPRPHLAVFLRCKNLSIRGVALLNSAFWSTHFNQCSYVHLDSMRIHARVNFNNDGFHFDGCQHVEVSNCHVACEDDACGLFGNTRNVTITNCTFSTRWSVFRFADGAVEDITISNCVIYDTFGCPIKMQARHGVRFENILFSNLVMNNVTGPIYIGLGSPPANSETWWYWTAARAGGASPGGIVRNIAFEGIWATIAPVTDLRDYPYAVGSPIDGIYEGEHRTCINLTAVDGQFIENITLRDFHVTFPGGGTAAEAALRQVPQMSGNEYFSFGVLPAYGMYARNVRGLTLDDVRFDLASPDLRPALVFDHVEDIALNMFSADGNPNAESLLRFTATRDVLLAACRALKPCAAFLQVEGTANEGITIAASDLSKAASPLTLSRGAAKEAVKLRS
jgi:hypothetical protein